jgi:aminomuconate-semialdehyde/2-hydroxymuconate-6-semialdehyde dehydrogenase
VRPTVLVDVRQDMRVCREEIFAPVVVVQPCDGDDEPSGCQRPPYGRNAMVFTESLRRAHRVAAAIRAGTIWVNGFFVRDLRAPFGGYKDSGNRSRRRPLQPGVLHRGQGRGDAALARCGKRPRRCGRAG